VQSRNAPESFARKYLWIVNCLGLVLHHEFIGIAGGSAREATVTLAGIVVARLRAPAEVVFLDPDVIAATLGTHRSHRQAIEHDCHEDRPHLRRRQG